MAHHRPIRRTATFGALAWSLVVGAGACSATHVDAAASSDAAASGEAVAAGDGAAPCMTGGLHVDTFAPGLKKLGTAGLFTFVLASADPSPPNDPQMNTWTIRVLDQSGAPVKGATVSLPAGDMNWSHPKNPWMPNMHHGNSVTNTVTNNGDGTATLGIYFSMTGLWQTYIMVQAGQMTDAAMYSFCFP